MKFSTKAIHAGQDRSDNRRRQRADYQTSPMPGGWANTRVSSTPGLKTRPEALEQNRAALERPNLLASHQEWRPPSVMTLLKAAITYRKRNTYGGTFRLFDKVLRNFGLEFQLRGCASLHVETQRERKLAWFSSKRRQTR